MRKLDFVVYGEPKGKGRPRFAKMGNIVTTYTDKETEIYENKVMLSYKTMFNKVYKGTNDYLFPKGTYVSMQIDCYFSLNKGDYGKNGLNKNGREKISRTFCDKKPDIDNVIKAILDGLNGVAYTDDSQVVDISCSKCYTELSPRVEIRMKEIGILKECN